MTELPKWIAPGDAATLVWYSGRGESAEGVPLYPVAGPALDTAPASPYFLLTPLKGVISRAETPVLRLVDVWRASPDRPLLPYLDEIGAFLPGERPLFVTPEAYAVARQEPEQFGTAWVCDECGEAEDAGAFLWTTHAGPSVRVCVLIQNDAGDWSCRLHPLEFLKEAA